MADREGGGGMDNDLEVGRDTPHSNPAKDELLRQALLGWKDTLQDIQALTARHERLMEAAKGMLEASATLATWAKVSRAKEALRAALAEEKEEPQPCTCPRPSWNRTHGTRGSTVRFGCQIIYPTCPVHGEKEEQGR